MATVLQQLGSLIGISSQSSQPSGVSAPAGSSNLAFSLALNNIGVFNSETLYLAGSTDNATITASGNGHNIIIGGPGFDHLTGGSGPDLIIGGPGTNVMAGGGGTDVFGHEAGATDYITDFSAAAGEKIALQTGLHFTGSQATSVPASVVTPSATGSVPGVQLTFSDGSTVTLLNSHETPDQSWFI